MLLYSSRNFWGILPLILLLISILAPCYVQAVDAGIGLELESGEVMLTADGCNEKDTFRSIQKTIDGREGEDWQLTGDMGDDAGLLTAEYILDGKKIKLGSKRLAKAAEEAADDYVTDYSNHKVCLRYVS